MEDQDATINLNDDSLASAIYSTAMATNEAQGLALTILHAHLKALCDEQLKRFSQH